MSLSSSSSRRCRPPWEKHLSASSCLSVPRDTSSSPPRLLLMAYRRGCSLQQGLASRVAAGPMSAPPARHIAIQRELGPQIPTLCPSRMGDAEDLPHCQSKWECHPRRPTPSTPSNQSALVLTTPIPRARPIIASIANTSVLSESHTTYVVVSTTFRTF